MSNRNFRFAAGLRSFGRRIATGLMFGVAVCMAMSAQAGFHFWTIREIYTDASGTNQFIEFFTASGSQQFVGGQTVFVTNAAGTMTHSLTISSNFPVDSANHAFLIGTASINTFGAPAPNFIIPANFLFPEGGRIKFFGQGSGPYTNLPTDGSLSRIWNSGNAVNSPQNFSGTVGQIVIPTANQPPIVSITAPANGAVYGSPNAVTVAVSASDPGGSVANVQLQTNGVAAATNTVAPFGFSLTNLPAGSYALRARALDNLGLAATSAPVNITVLAGLQLSAGHGLSGPVRFQFNTVTGATYIVDRAQPLTNFVPIATNPGNGGVIQFSETNGVPSQGTYRVRVQ